MEMEQNENQLPDDNDKNITERSLIDLSKMDRFRDIYSPYKWVISNDENDYLCHTIFIISTSEYFNVLYQHTNDQYQLKVTNNDGSKETISVPRFVTNNVNIQYISRK